MASSLETSNWVCPVVSFEGRVPVISNGFRAGAHDGLDFAYLAQPYDPPATKNAAGKVVDTRYRTKRFYNRDGLPALAAGDGRVDKVWRQKNGLWCSVFHPRERIRSLYGHLALYGPSTVKGTEVRAGDVLGWVGPEPAIKGFVHLHFALRRPNRTWVDPARYVAHWRMMGLQPDGSLSPVPFE